MDNFKSMSHFSELIMVELSTCADNDNFGGQNKNCIVVWFIICLVETFFFHKWNYFLCEAPWKNLSGRLFNFFKVGYNHKNIHIFYDMVKTLSVHNRFNVWTMNTTKFINYEKFIRKIKHFLRLALWLRHRFLPRKESIIIHGS